MQIICGKCSKVFQVDIAAAHKYENALCECGNVLNLTDSSNQGFPTTQIGPYVLVEKIGQGGMGEVFIAKKVGEAGFEQTLCIKKMLGHFSRDEEFVSMLIEEAKLTAQLRHANIVQVVDFAKDGDEYYIAMEYVDGIDLTKLVRSCQVDLVQIPWQVAVHITLQVLRALNFAHNMKFQDGSPMNIIHRDIAPSNILVSKDGQVKLTDFGIAKAAGRATKTSPGILKGKMAYFSPEQLSGKQIDHRVDIFAIAIVLWEILTLRPLFAKEDDYQTLKAITTGAVQPISKYREDVPQKVEQILLKALLKDPSKRFQNAAHFSKALSKAALPQSEAELEDTTRQFFSSYIHFFNTKNDEVDPDSKTYSFDTNGGTLVTSVDNVAPTGSYPSITDLTTDKKQLRDTVVDTVQPKSIKQVSTAQESKKKSSKMVKLLGIGGLVVVAVIGGVLLIDGNMIKSKARALLDEPVSHDSSQGVVIKTPTQYGLTVNDIQTQLITKRDEFARCVERYANKDSKENITIRAKIVINPSGKVRQVTVTPKKTPHPVAVKCISSVIRRTQFPRHSRKKMTFVVPLEFNTFTMNK